VKKIVVKRQPIEVVKEVSEVKNKENELIKKPPKRTKLSYLSDNDMTEATTFGNKRAFNSSTKLEKLKNPP